MLPVLTTLGSMSLEVLVHRRHASAQRRNKPKKEQNMLSSKEWVQRRRRMKRRLKIIAIQPTLRATCTVWNSRMVGLGGRYLDSVG